MGPICTTIVEMKLLAIRKGCDVDMIDSTSIKIFQGVFLLGRNGLCREKEAHL